MHTSYCKSCLNDMIKESLIPCLKCSLLSKFLNMKQNRFFLFINTACVHFKLSICLPLSGSWLSSMVQHCVRDENGQGIFLPADDWLERGGSETECLEVLKWFCNPKVQVHSSWRTGNASVCKSLDNSHFFKAAPF